MEREFTYLNLATRNGDVLEVKLPYSTEKRYETHALDPYRVFLGTEDGMKTQRVEVSEEDVLLGRSIDLTF